MPIGRTIRILRAFHNINQPQLSRRTHLSQFTISRIETGTQQPNKQHLAALEDGLGVKFTDPRLARGLQIIDEILTCRGAWRLHFLRPPHTLPTPLPTGDTHNGKDASREC